MEMTKAKLIEAMREFDDDAPITIAVFFEEGTVAMCNIEHVVQNGLAIQIGTENVNATEHGKEK